MHVYISLFHTKLQLVQKDAVFDKLSFFLLLQVYIVIYRPNLGSYHIFQIVVSKFYLFESDNRLLVQKSQSCSTE